MSATRGKAEAFSKENQRRLFAAIKKFKTEHPNADQICWPTILKYSGIKGYRADQLRQRYWNLYKLEQQKNVTAKVTLQGELLKRQDQPRRARNIQDGGAKKNKIATSNKQASDHPHAQPNKENATCEDIQAVGSIVELFNQDPEPSKLLSKIFSHPKLTKADLVLLDKAWPSVVKKLGNRLVDMGYRSSFLLPAPRDLISYTKKDSEDDKICKQPSTILNFFATPKNGPTNFNSFQGQTREQVRARLAKIYPPREVQPFDPFKNCAPGESLLHQAEFRRVTGYSSNFIRLLTDDEWRLICRKLLLIYPDQTNARWLCSPDLWSSILQETEIVTMCPPEKVILDFFKYAVPYMDLLCSQNQYFACDLSSYEREAAIVIFHSLCRFNFVVENTIQDLLSSRTLSSKVSNTGWKNYFLDCLKTIDSSEFFCCAKNQFAIIRHALINPNASSLVKKL